MEHESMKTRLGGVTILRAGAALALVAALAACGGGSGTTTAGGGGSQCAAGETLVGGDCLTAAQVAANEAVEAADEAANALVDARLVNATQADIDRVNGLITTAQNMIEALDLDEDEETEMLEGLADARIIVREARDFLAELAKPDPGSVHVANSGAAALDARTAYTTADTARKSAEAAHKLLGSGGTGVQTGNDLGGTIALKGESEEGRARAQAIIDAVATLKTQKEAADKAVKDIDAARAAFVALGSENVDNYAGRLASIDVDLAEAKRHQGLIDAINLEGELYRVRGASGDRTPADFADYVASAINDAFVKEGGADGSDGADARTLVNWWLSDYDPNGTANWVSHHGGEGGPRDTLTAAQEKTIARTGSLKGSAPAGYVEFDLDSQDRLPVGGMALSLFTDLGTGAEDNVLTDTDLTAIIGGGTPAPRDVLFKGLRAELRCSVAAGTGCESEDGALTGPWVLVQPGTLATAATIRGIDAPGGTVLTNLFREIDGIYREFGGGYVEYGYWLEGTDDDPRIVTFAVRTGSGFGAGSLIRVSDSEAGNLVQSATYEGEAHGISVVETYDQRDRDTRNTVVSRKSGNFTADVKLEADFAGANPEIEGDITNFQGNAVGDGWRVELRPANIDRDNGGVASGADPVTVGYIGSGNSRSGSDGVWNFNMVGGSATERPTDVYGGFGAYFPDGKAAGGYEASR